ncbi:hypothetical protein MSG28_008519, partial [Choristoneura fumiferana]
PWGGSSRAWVACAAPCCCSPPPPCTAAALLYWRQQTDERAAPPATHHLNQQEVDRTSVNTILLMPLPLAMLGAPKERGDEPQWTWICRNDRCERLLVSESTTLQSLATCNMLCASTQLWPQPTGPVSLATLAVPLRADGLALHVLASPSPEVTDHLGDAFALMREDLRALERTVSEARRGAAGPPRPVLVRVGVNGSGDPRMRLDTDESYKLSLGPHAGRLVANITAQSFCGARHGLETLAQLVWADPYAGSLLYRGLLLDTARNYFPVGELLRTVDAMGANKLNTFHWHASDSQAFPLRLASAPQLAAHGAYGAGAVYTPDEVRAVVRRARLRGVRVLLEVDTPAHVGRAWAWAPPPPRTPRALRRGRALERVLRRAALRPAQPAQPARIYAEIIQLTGVDDLFHLGGDEVSERCWTQHFNDTDPMELWLEFRARAYRALERANGGKAPELTLLWSSRLTRSPCGARRAGPSRAAVLDAGFRAVISHVDAWYWTAGSARAGQLGRALRAVPLVAADVRAPAVAEEAGGGVGGGGASSAGEPAAAWRVEGGAACQWTEQLAPGGLDARVWPRAAALAERLCRTAPRPPRPTCTCGWTRSARGCWRAGSTRRRSGRA